MLAPPDPVLVRGFPAKPDDFADFAGGIDDVGDALVVPAAHRSTDSGEDGSAAGFQPARRHDVNGAAKHRR